MPTPKKKAARKSPRKAVPKVSALRGKTVEDYLRAKVSGWQADTVREICALLKREAPEAAQVLKWGQPIFELHGPMAYVRSSAKHVTFGFWRGAKMTDPGGRLEGDGDRMKHVKLTSSADVKAPELKGWIRQAVKLNKAHGDPTRG